MINVTTIISVIFAIFYIVILSVIARIDQKQIKIEKRTTMAGIGLAILYIISNYIIKPESIKYGIIYLGIYIILIAVDTFITKRYAKNRYVDGILLMLITILIYSGEYVTINAIIWTLLAVSIYTLIHKMKEKKNRSRKTDKQITEKISIGFYLGITNVISLLVVLFCSNYIL